MPFWRDAGTRMEADGKHIRLTNGAVINERAPRLQEHFVDDLVTGRWTATDTGVGAGHAAFTVAATANDGGFATGVAGATTNNAEEIGAKHVIYKPSLSTTTPLVLEVRAKVVGTTTAADGDFVIGLADAATYASGLAYVVSAASALTTTAPTEAAGFYYSSIPTSGTLFNAAGNNFLGFVTTTGGVGTVGASTVAKDSGYHIFRVEIASSGRVTYVLDGAVVGSGLITAATALTPYIAVVGKNSHANTGTVSYVFCGADLPTT